MYFFSAEVGSRGYHVYRNTSWNQIYLNQAVVVHKEKNIVSLQIDPCCCAITITHVDKIGPVTVGHIPREVSRFAYFFLHEQGAISGTVVDTEPRMSPIPEGGLEIKLLLNFTHPVERILNRMKELVVKQLSRLEDTFQLSSEDEEDENEDNTYDDNIIIADQEDQEEEEIDEEQCFPNTISNKDVSKSNAEKEVIVLDY